MDDLMRLDEELTFTMKRSDWTLLAVAARHYHDSLLKHNTWYSEASRRDCIGPGGQAERLEGIRRILHYATPECIRSEEPG